MSEDEDELSQRIYNLNTLSLMILKSKQYGKTTRCLERKRVVLLLFTGKNESVVNLMIFISFESFTFWFDTESIIPCNFGFARY